MNKTMLLGRLTKDPELNFTANSGTAVCKFGIAVNRIKKGEVDFINCIAFGKTGETIAQYFTKGGLISIVGRIQTGSYDNKQGNKVYTTDVVIENFYFTGNNGGSNTNKASNNGYGGNFEEDMTSVDDGDMPF